MASDETLPKAVWSGSFVIAGVEIKCHTLDDGSRIIEADSMAEFFANAGMIQDRLIEDKKYLDEIGETTAESEVSKSLIAFMRWQRGQ